MKAGVIVLLVVGLVYPAFGETIFDKAKRTFEKASSLKVSDLPIGSSASFYQYCVDTKNPNPAQPPVDARYFRVLSDPLLGDRIFYCSGDKCETVVGERPDGEVGLLQSDLILKDLIFRAFTTKQGKRHLISLTTLEDKTEQYCWSTSSLN